MKAEKSLQELVADLKRLLDEDHPGLGEIVWPKRMETRVRKIEVEKVEAPDEKDPD